MAKNTKQGVRDLNDLGSKKDKNGRALSTSKERELCKHPHCTSNHLYTRKKCMDCGQVLVWENDPEGWYWVPDWGPERE